MDKVARKYKRLNYSDRKAIEAMCKEGKRVTEIAEAMDVHRVVLCQEKVQIKRELFHNTILNLQLIPILLTLSNTYLHIHLAKDIHNGCVS